MYFNIEILFLFFLKKKKQGYEKKTLHFYIYYLLKNLVKIEIFTHTHIYIYTVECA